MKFRPVNLLVPLLLSLPCAAQQPQPVQQAPVAEPTANIDDVVVVQGWRHPVQLRLQMVEAEIAVYDLFNQLTDDASLILDCSKRNIGGTRLQTTDCAPRFEAQALQQEGQDTLAMTREYLNSVAATSSNFASFASGGANPGGGEEFSSYTPMTMGMPAHLQIKTGQVRLKREMDRIAAEHPEFMEMVTKYVDAKSRYTQALQRVAD